MEYAFLNRFYPSWTITDIQHLSRQEREWWIRLGIWKTEKGS